MSAQSTVSDPIRVDEFRLDVVTGPTVMDRGAGFSHVRAVAVVSGYDWKVRLERIKQAGDLLSVECARCFAVGRIVELQNTGSGISIALELEDLGYRPKSEAVIVTRKNRKRLLGETPDA